jgi:hypothetical protein
LREGHDNVGAAGRGLTKPRHQQKPVDTVQQFFAHRDVRTAKIYTHVLNRGGHGVKSPADAL